MMLKSELVEGRVRDVCFHQHVEVALHVCALDVKCVASQIAIARLASTSERIQKLKEYFVTFEWTFSSFEPMYFVHIPF